MMRSQSDAEIAAQAASLAGELLLQLRQAAVTGEVASVALEADVLRAAGDRDANHAIMKLLANERPEDSLLSEEAADDPRRLIAERVWIMIRSTAHASLANETALVSGVTTSPCTLRSGSVVRD